jgi:hypothetical protein
MITVMVMMFPVYITLNAWLEKRGQTSAGDPT